MANPTTNFGWVMPASTDLVTDLPADFAVFGDAVDSDLSTGGGYSTTATAAGTTTMTVSSNRTQFFTGSTTQTVVMPVTSTLTLGWQQRIVNNSSGVVTVQSSGANTIYAVPAGGDVIFTCILASGTTAASWDYKNHISSGTSGASVNVLALTAGANKSTTSTSFVGIDTTNLRITATPSGTTAVGIFTGLYSMSGVSNGELRLNCGTGTTRGFQFYNSSYDSTTLLRTYQAIITGLTAGVSYNFDWEWKVNAGTATLIGDTASVYPLMTVVC